MKGYVGIKTPEPNTPESLYALMQREGKFELPYELHGQGIMQSIVFPLDKNNIIQVGARKNKISVTVAKASMLKSIGMSALTDGWSDILDTSRKDNDQILREIAQEICRLTNGK